jgi:hypothetical protein
MMKMEKGGKKKGNEMRDNRRKDGKGAMLHLSPQRERRAPSQNSFHQEIETYFMYKQIKNEC